MTALSLPWPLPVSPSEPYRIVRTEAVFSSRPSAASPEAKRCAAAIGPPVCELDGPMPILNRSKTLIAIYFAMAPRASIACWYSRPAR